MLISCRFSVVGLHLLLLAHIAHSFVLLTANVDDVKKIARKFVSESLAEKIADFIARATDTMSQNKNISEENEKNARVQQSAEVSAENRMFNVERQGGESQVTEVNSKEEIVLGKVTVKVPKTTAVEKKKHRFDEPTTRKSKREPKPLHGRSRYIVESENKDSLATEKALSKLSEEDNFHKMKESIQQLEENLFSTPEDGTTKHKKQKRKVKGKAFKLLSSFASVENDAAKDGITENKGTKDDEILFNVRANDEKVLSLPTEETETTRIEQDFTENEKQTETTTTDVAHYETKYDENTEMVASNEPLQKKRNDEFDHYENKIVQKTHKAVTTGSRSFVGEPDDKEVNWWEKQLPASDEEINKRKSWF